MSARPSLSIVLVIGIVSLTCSAAAQDAIHSEPGHKGDLVSALEFISKTFRLPIIAELTKSYPPHVSVSSGEHSAQQLLSEVISQSPGYTWMNENGVVLFCNGDLRDAAGNFFNSKIGRYVMPSDLAQLKLELNQIMGAPPGTAPVMVGIPERSLQNVKLREGEVLTNITGRQVLVEAAKQSGDVFSVVLFPSTEPTTQREISEAHMNWYLRSINELPQSSIRLRSVPQHP